MSGVHAMLVAAGGVLTLVHEVPAGGSGAVRWHKVTVSSGSGQYTYAWSIVSGAVTMDRANDQICSANLFNKGTVAYQLRCAVKDTVWRASGSLTTASYTLTKT